MDFLKENSLYTYLDKNDFISVDKKVVESFFFNFFGTLAFYQFAKKRDKIAQYLRSDKKLQLNNITDDNHDISLTVKLMNDKGFFKTQNVAKEMLRFLSQLKKGSVQEIDVDMIVDWMENVRPSAWRKMSPTLLKLKDNFLKNKDLYTLALGLKGRALVVDSDILGDFNQIRKLVKLEPPQDSYQNIPTPDVEVEYKYKNARTLLDDVIKGRYPVDKMVDAVTELSLDEKAKIFDYFFMEGSDKPQAIQFLDEANLNEFYSKDLDGLLEKLDILDLIRKTQTLEKNGAFEAGVLGEKYIKTFWSVIIDKVNTLGYRNPEFNIFNTEEINYLKKRASLDNVNEFYTSDEADPGNFLLDALTKSRDEIIQKYSSYKFLKFSFKGNKANVFPEHVVAQYFLKYLGFERFKPQDDALEAFTTRQFSFFDEERFKKVRSALQNDPQAKEKVLGFLDDLIFWTQVDNEVLEAFFNAFKDLLDLDDIARILGNSEIISTSRGTARWYINLFSYYVKNQTPENISSFLESVKYDLEPYFSSIMDVLSESKDSGVIEKMKKVIMTLFKNNIETVEYLGLMEYNYFYDIMTPDEKREIMDYVIEASEEYFDKSPKGKRAFATKLYLSKMAIALNMSYKDLSPAGKKKVVQFAKIRPMAVFSLIDSGMFSENPNLALEFNPSEVASMLFLAPFDSERKEAISKALFSREYIERWFNRANEQEFQGLLELASKSPNLRDVAIEQIMKLLEDGDLKALKDSETFSKVNSILEFTNDLDLQIKTKILKLLMQGVGDGEYLQRDSDLYLDVVASFQMFWGSVLSEDRNAADELFRQSPIYIKKALAGKFLDYIGLKASISGALEDGVIRPFEKLSEKRIMDLLKYNHITPNDLYKNLGLSALKSLQTLEEWAKENVAEIKPLEDLHVKDQELTKIEVEKLTLDLHQRRRAGKHGKIGVKVHRVFDVAIPLQEELQKKWLDRNPDQEVIESMYHGTGSIAASMILRYGFSVIKSGDPLVVGRMLGDGVYGAIHFDKSAQYVGDNGFTRSIGTRGYIFEMFAALGEKDKDYKVAGLGGDGIRSPEWCVFTPNAQFRIYKAYEVELVSREEMEEIAARNDLDPALLREEKRRVNFKEFIELNEGKQMRNTISRFTFVNGKIPLDYQLSKVIDFEKFKNTPDIFIEPSAYGPTLVVKGLKKEYDVTAANALDLRINNREAFRELIAAISKK